MQKHPHTLLSLTATAFVAVVGLIFVAPGCSDEAATSTCYDYAAFNGTTPAVKFATDVLPIFRRSCGFAGSCHGSPTPPAANQPFLGPPMADPAPDAATIAKIFTQNVGVNAAQASTMKIVEAGSPKTSFLMHKMDDTLECADVKCDASCGQAMPLGTPMLAETERDIVRRWIAQGAKND